MRFFWGLRGASAVSAPEILLARSFFCELRSETEGNREWIKPSKGNWIVKKEANPMDRVMCDLEPAIRALSWIFSVPVWSFLRVAVPCGSIHPTIASYRRIVVSKFGLRFQTLFALSGLIQRLVCGGIRSVHENSEPTPVHMCHWTAAQYSEVDVGVTEDQKVWKWQK